VMRIQQDFDNWNHSKIDFCYRCLILTFHENFRINLLSQKVKHSRQLII
jgi:hypothetical protein